MKNNITAVLLAACCWLLFGSCAEQNLIPTSRDVLSTLEKSHPRLILKERDLAELKARLKSDELLQKCRDDVLDEADGYLDLPILTYREIGPRLLQVSRECLSRMYALGLAWRLTGQNGRQLIAKILSPANASFVTESAEQRPPEKPNRGVKRLMIRLKEQRGDVRVAVLLSPVRDDTRTMCQPEVIPLANW